MGTKLGKIQSESKQTVKTTREEYSLIKSIWSRIEFEPKLHGTEFYTRYPQYIKYFLTDPMVDDVNPDALMVIKFTAIFEVLGYLVLDFHNKPKQFNQLLGYVAMMHKDMYLDLEDMNNFFTVLIDYLKDVIRDLMTDICERVFVDFFANFQQLMIKSMAEKRQRFTDQFEEGVVVRSHLKVLVPCLWLDHSNKLIYGQPREYWEIREQAWNAKMKLWEEEAKLASVTVNLKNNADSTTSEDEDRDKGEVQDDSDSEILDNDPDDDSSLFRKAGYSNNARLASLPHFDHQASELSDNAETDGVEESYLINSGDDRSTGSVRMTPRERHRAVVAARRFIPSRPSVRLTPSTETDNPRYSDGSAARERRRSTWN